MVRFLCLGIRIPYGYAVKTSREPDSLQKAKQRLCMAVFYLAPTASDCNVRCRNVRKSAVSAPSGSPLREI